MKVRIGILAIALGTFVQVGQCYCQDTFALINRWANGGTQAVESGFEIYFLGNGGILTAYSYTDNIYEEQGRFLVDGVIDEIAVDSQTVYVADDLGNLYVLDASDTSKMELLSKTDFSQPINALGLKEQFLYVISSSFVHSFDVSNPSNPIEGQRLSIPSQARSIALRDNLAYVGTSNWGLHILDISNELEPLLIGRYIPDSQNVRVPFGLTLSDIYDIALKDSMALIGAGLDGFVRLNISDPENPSYYDRFDSCDSPQTCDRILNIEILDDNTAVATGNFSDIRVLEIGSPATAPQLISTVNWKSEFVNLVGVEDMLVADSKLFVVTGPMPGLRVLDLSSTSEPEELSSIDLGGHSALGLALAGDSLFLSSGLSGLRILDISDLNSLSEIDLYRPDNDLLTSDGIRNAVVHNSAIIAVGDGMYILERDNTGKLIEQGAVRDELPRDPFDLSDILVVGDCMIVRAGRLGIRIYDIADRSNPELLSQFSSLSEGLLYFAPNVFNVFREGRVLVDISDKEDPVIGDVIFDSSPNFAAAQHNQYIFLLSATGLQIYDGTDPFNLMEVGFLTMNLIETNLNEKVERMIFNEDILYIAAGTQGLVLVDVSDVANPEEVGRYETPYSVEDVAVDGDTIFLADREGGLYVLERTTDTSTSLDEVNEILETPYVYPNPSSGTTTLLFSTSNPEITKISVFDSLGRKMHGLDSTFRQNGGKHRVSLNTKKLPTGSYFIQIKNSETSKTIQFVKR